jgi:ABC-type Fe3+/spermidine/putrescine transport system ATPase subunit
MSFDDRTPATEGATVDETLRVANLSLRYGSSVAFSDLSFTVARGEFLALLGPSGCGKTSLLRSIAGLAHPQQGSILVKGRDVINVPTRHRNIGLVFQSYALFPHMTAEQNVAFGLRCRRLPKGQIAERVRSALDMVGLTKLAARRPAELSGGQQQRVALARALVFEPDLLLLDEALGALDRKLRVEMQTELKRLQQISGITTVFVTHDQEEALAMADRVAVMSDGRIVQLDTPADLFRRPKSPWVADFMGAGTVIEGEVSRPGPQATAVLTSRSGVEIRIDESASRLQCPTGRCLIYVRADKLRLEPAIEGTLRVSSVRFLGAHFEVRAQHGSDSLRAIIGASAAEKLGMGDSVRGTIMADDCVHLLVPGRDA